MSKKIETEEDSERYVLTPKACFLSALEEAEFIPNGLVDTIQTRLAWRTFVDLMVKHGYVGEDTI